MLEKYEKELANAEQPQTPVNQPTLKELLTDKDKSSLFGDMLEREGNVELANRLARGELTELDLDDLQSSTTSFNETMSNVELVKKSITPDSLKVFAKNNPEFAKIMTLVGPESAVNIYQKQMAALAISDPDTFQRLSNATRYYNEYTNGAWKDLDAEIKEDLKKYNISEASFAKSIAIEDDEERSQALRGTVREGYNWFQKAGDWLTIGALSKSRVEMMEWSKTDIDGARRNLNDLRGGVGSMLAYSANDNEKVRQALSQELIGEKIQTPPTEGFKDMKSSIPSKESFISAWNTFKTTQASDWDELPENTRDEVRNAFIESQKAGLNAKATKEKGLWASIFGSIFDMFSSNNRSELK